jgi:hypothetical protein
MPGVKGEPRNANFARSMRLHPMFLRKLEHFLCGQVGLRRPPGGRQPENQAKLREPTKMRERTKMRKEL